MKKIPEIAKNKKYIAVLILILIIGGYYWYSKSKSKTGQTQYVTTVAEKGTLTTFVSASGSVIVDQSSNIDPTITGTVANLAVSIGDKVTKGQLLFNIVNNDLSVSVAKAKSSLESSANSIESARVQVKSAKADHADAEKSGSGVSTAGKAVLKRKVDLAEDGVTAAEKSYQATLADYNNTLSDAAKRNVTSPIDGTVNSINVKNGDDLSKLSSGSSRTVPIIIGDLSTQKAQVQVNEVDISNVQIGQKATLTFDALPDFTATGKVEKMDSLGTTTQGVVTYNVTIAFDSLDPRIKPDMSVTADIITTVKQNVIIVPNSAVKTQGGSSYVEVLNSGNTPTQVNVQTGTSNNTDTEITSGLNVGDKVVTQTVNPTATTGATTSSSRNSGGGNVRIPGVGGFGR
ncbi:MAG: efflux RND transporter periplasmic adaptor subunit [Parcubacteria group bacterium]|jgi:HlyD family secretion protein